MPTHSNSKITQFKKELWIDMSNTCDSRFWTYSTSEKRLFFILLFLLGSLSIYYFNSYRQEARVVKAQIQAYAQYNATSLKKITTNKASGNFAIEDSSSGYETQTTVTPTPIQPKKSYIYSVNLI